jgi:hypothetical protein
MPPLFNAQPDLVIAADVVWVEALIQPLVDALGCLCGPATVVVLAHQSRSTRSDDAFFSRIDASFDRCARVLPLSGSFLTAWHCRIFTCHRIAQPCRRIHRQKIPNEQLNPTYQYPEKIGVYRLQKK